jgi:hypothetical protein
MSFYQEMMNRNYFKVAMNSYFKVAVNWIRYLPCLVYSQQGKDEGIAKKRSRKAVRVTRAIVGASVEDLLKKRLVSKPKVVVSDAALK